MNTNFLKNKKTMIFTVIFLLLFLVMDIALSVYWYKSAQDSTDKISAYFAPMMFMIWFAPFFMHQILFLYECYDVFDIKSNAISKTLLLLSFVLSGIIVLLYTIIILNVCFEILKFINIVIYVDQPLYVYAYISVLISIVLSMVGRFIATSKKRKKAE